MNEQDIPRDLEFAAIESSIERDKANLVKNKELSKVLDQIREDCTKEVLALVGPKTNEYQEFRQKRREYAAKMRPLFRPTPQGEQVKNEFKRKSLAEALEFVKGLGIDTNKIVQVQKKYLEKSRSALQKTFNIPHVPYDDHISTTELPVGPDDPWTRMYPPYVDSWGTTSHFRSSGRTYTWASHWEDNLTGEIYCGSDMRLIDPDYDSCWTEAYSGVFVWFQMPASGSLEAWMYLQASGSPYFSGVLEDEWGWSSAEVEQLSDPFLEVVQPGSNRHTNHGNLLTYVRGDDEGSWWGEIAQPNGFRYVHLNSDKTFVEGEWLCILLGIHDFQYIYADDMTCKSTLWSKWFVRQIALKSTGSFE
jgi:hypothetical protein